MALFVLNSNPDKTEPKVKSEKRLSQWPMKEKRPLRDSAKAAKKIFKPWFKKNKLAFFASLAPLRENFLPF
jgi:hypothetical protein